MRSPGMTAKPAALARLASLAFAALSGCAAQAPLPRAPRSVAEVLAATSPGDWEVLDPANLLVMDLPRGRVVIELARAFAPAHVANLEVLAREAFFDGLAVVRVQDNYVTQWGDPRAEEPGAKPLGGARRELPAELVTKREVPFTALPDPDTYAPEAGFSGGFPVARDPSRGEAWIPHCYGVVGAGRNEGPATSNGAELYVVIGQAPRHLDRNMTMVGRLVAGVEHLSSLPRGTGALGFYKTAEERTLITRARIASELPRDEQPRLERLRTDTRAFRSYVEARRSRREPFFVEPLGRLDVCNLQLPVRPETPR
jgi:peptidylprolyl isomerase